MTLPVPPAPVSPDNQPFFDGLAGGRLVLPRCARCSTVIWYPRHLCPACGSLDVTWFDGAGTGTVYSLTTVRRGMGEWAAAGAFVLAYVELDEGPRVLTNIVGVEASTLAIGSRVAMVVERAEGVPPVLRFRPA